MTDDNDTREISRDRTGHQGETMIPMPVPGKGWTLVPLRWVRDAAVSVTGVGLLTSQVLVQMVFHDEPNVALIGAGVTLLTAVPLFWVGDRRG